MKPKKKLSCLISLLILIMSTSIAVICYYQSSSEVVEYIHTPNGFPTLKMLKNGKMVRVYES